MDGKKKKRNPLYLCEYIIIYLLMCRATLLIGCRQLGVLCSLHLLKPFAMSAVPTTGCFEGYHKHR